MKMLTGIGKTDRERMAAIIRGTKGTISVEDAARILDVSSTDAAKMLSRWTKKGWMSRVRRGLYVSVPLESRTADMPIEDPWLVADRLFSPCYIGGWSAAEYFGLTEQIFSTIILNVAKVEDAPGPRHQGRSCSHLPQGLDNAGDGVSSAFPSGKQHGEKRFIIGYHWQLYPGCWQ